MIGFDSGAPWVRKFGYLCIQEILVRTELPVNIRLFMLADVKCFTSLTLGRTRKFIPPPWYKGGGGGWNPSTEFLICCSILKHLTFSGKSLIFLTRGSIFYGWWRCWRPVTSPTMVAILDFTENWKTG